MVCVTAKVDHADESTWIVVAKTSFTRNHFIEPVLFPEYVCAVSQYYTPDELSHVVTPAMPRTCVAGWHQANEAQGTVHQHGDE